jgi:hypothetical protein
MSSCAIFGVCNDIAAAASLARTNWRSGEESFDFPPYESDVLDALEAEKHMERMRRDGYLAKVIGWLANREEVSSDVRRLADEIHVAAGSPRPIARMLVKGSVRFPGILLLNPQETGRVAVTLNPSLSYAALADYPQALKALRRVFHDLRPD